MAGSPAKVEVTVLSGTRVRLTATFTPLGTTVPADPSSVVFKTLAPTSGAEATTYTYGVDAAVVRSSAGVFYLDVTCNARGTWWMQVKGSGPSGIQAVAEVAVQCDGTVIS